MKVKMISGYSYVNLEEEINKFIKDVKVIDIKFQIKDSNSDRYISMVMYEELVDRSELACPEIEIGTVGGNER